MFDHLNTLTMFILPDSLQGKLLQRQVSHLSTGLRSVHFFGYYHAVEADRMPHKECWFNS